MNFVVEQTGYPPDLVELDADLEADLGIDSIKKAQLFGELQEYFDVTPSENLTLDDFPTLRHVVSYLTENLAPTPIIEEAPSTATQTFVSPTPTAHFLEPPQASVVTPPEPVEVAKHVVEVAANATLTAFHVTDEIRKLRLAGSAYEMGVIHGQKFRTEIRRLMYRVADLADSEESAAWTKLAKKPELTFTEDQLAELEGIADAVHVPIANVVALNLAMFAELSSSSIQFAMEVERNGRAVRHGLRDESFQGSRLGDCFVPILQIRQPKLGIPSVAVTYAGCVGALAGLNVSGLAVTSGLIVSGPATMSQRHALLTQQILTEAGDIPAALDALKHAPQSGPWNMVLSSLNRLPVSVECSGESLEMVESNLVVAANHSAVNPESGSSVKRLNNLQQFLTGSSYSPSDLEMALTSYGVESDQHLSVLIDHNAGELGVQCGVVHEKNQQPFTRFNLEQLLADVSSTEKKQPKGPEFSVKPYDLGDEPGMAERFVMRLVDVAWPPNSPAMPTLNGPVLVIGDNPSADALSDRLKSVGAKVHRLNSLDSQQHAVASIEQICADEPVMHLFLMSSRDTIDSDVFDTAAWQHAYESQVIAPFFLCQRWVQLASEGKWLDKCTLVATANCNGDFGFCGDVPTPSTGALTGLVKSLYLEINHMGGKRSFLAKAIDFPDDETPCQVARFICGELAVGTPDYEVSYVNGTRYLQVAIPREARSRRNLSIRLAATGSSPEERRGITAECALELGRRFGVKLHLLGTSPAYPRSTPAWRNLDEAGRAALRTETILRARETNDKPNEAWDRVQKQIEIDRNLRAFSDAGLDITYHTATSLIVQLWTRCSIQSVEGMALSRGFSTVLALNVPADWKRSVPRMCRPLSIQKSSVRGTSCSLLAMTPSATSSGSAR